MTGGADVAADVEWSCVRRPAVRQCQVPRVLRHNDVAFHRLSTLSLTAFSHTVPRKSYVESEDLFLTIRRRWGQKDRDGINRGNRTGEDVNGKNGQSNLTTRMWANAQRNGRPAEYRWRPLFNPAKFG